MKLEILFFRKQLLEKHHTFSNAYLGSTQRYPHIIQNYFREKHVAYAAA
ncbi:hypothetical protein AVDCRST_MAG81-3750 [uncultured Synechococcales cyanobacterium]|uniref:Uncharacterized protein n=1 Tax=uncultured Synechococcales cyanobacterium TaxID=1936017 RepID=A0A6J4VV21_9CYAN|nr:hypothetical protein AVDCRST_MAG81-3750 [uncultured Synechococcales cyanobacterium]